MSSILESEINGKLTAWLSWRGQLRNNCTLFFLLDLDNPKRIVKIWTNRRTFHFYNDRGWFLVREHFMLRSSEKLCVSNYRCTLFATFFCFSCSRNKRKTENCQKTTAITVSLKSWKCNTNLNVTQYIDGVYRIH